MALPKQNQAEAQVEEQESVTPELEEALEPAPPASEQNDSPAVSGQGSTPVTSSAGGQVQVLDQLAEAGFGGLHIDWTSFPTVVLNQGEFETADGNPLGADSITVRMMQTRNRYVLRTNVANDDDAELAYTYDLAELTNPESDVAQKVISWQKEGLDYKVKEYIEVVAVVEDADSSLDQQMVLLQIPPTSTGRLSGYIASNRMVKKLSAEQYLTRCYKGEKVSKAAKPFYPWAFEFISG